MLSSAVLLDAALTAREALARLARNGYWLDESDPEAKQHLERYAALMTEQADSSGGVVYQPDTAVLETAEAARLLRRPLEQGRVAIRWQKGATVYWFDMKAGEVLKVLTNVLPGTALRNALNLQAAASVPVTQVGHLPDPDALQQGIALRGQELVGVAEPSTVTLSVPRSGAESRSLGTSAGHTAERGITDGDPTEPRVEAYPAVRVSSSTVVVGVPFEVEIGLHRGAEPGRTARPMTIVGRPGARTIPVQVRVIAEGFKAPDGWWRILDVDPQNPEAARVTVTLEALPAQKEPTRQTSIIVQYAVDGVTCGTHSQHILVSLNPGDTMAAGPTGIDWIAEQPSSPGLTIGAILTPPDIELNIAKPDGNPARGEYMCTMSNAHGVAVPDEPLPISLGDDARTFAKVIIDDMRIWDGDPLLGKLFGGHGRTIQQKLPQPFWTMLREVATKVAEKEAGRPVTLQLNSAEPYVPWELAQVSPPIDATRPPMLGAQVVMARWILGDSSIAVPPRENMKVKAIAAMAGQYKAAESGLRALPKAEDEVVQLKERHSAMNYRCDPVALNALLDVAVGDGVQVVHFAGHGNVDPQHPEDAAIYLDNGKPLSPVLFQDTRLGREYAPFIFLNACMVGTSGELLGDYGGFPGKCLSGGFSALLAPLWAVDDAVAHDVALTFYDQAFATPPRPVADVLRDMRKHFTQHPTVSSYLAYVYYGNPNLRMTRV